MDEYSSFRPATDCCHSVQQELIQKSQHLHYENHDERLQRRGRRDSNQRPVESSGSGRVSDLSGCQNQTKHVTATDLLSNFSFIAYCIMVLWLWCVLVWFGVLCVVL